jgi:hypothetical protein
MKKAKTSNSGPGETPEGPLSKAFTADEIEKMKQNIPSTLETIFDLPEGEGKNIYDLLSVQLGAQNKDMYAVIERTDLTEEEIPIFRSLIMKAEHGINMPECGLDFTIPSVGEAVVFELRGRRSKGRESSHEFERTTTSWLASLKAREQAAQKENDKNKFVGGN